MRERQWLLKEPLWHLSTDDKHHETYKSGYTVTSKQTFEKTLGSELGWGAGPGGGLSASVRERLKLTSEFTREWHVEIIREDTVTYKANHVYASWELIDCLYLTKEVNSPYIPDPLSGTIDHFVPWFSQRAEFPVVIYNYDDVDPPER